MSAKFDEVEDIIKNLKAYLYNKLGKDTKIYVDMTLWDDDDYEIKVCHTGKDFLHRAFYHHSTKKCVYDKMEMEDVERKCAMLVCVVEVEDIVL